MWTLWALVACAPSRSELPQEGYVWQRAWTDELRDAVSAASAVFDGLRVNAAAVGADGERVHDVDLGALAATGRPAVPVIRVDADVPLDPEAAAALLADLARSWRAAGVRVPGVEVDHDCPTSALAAYAEAVTGVRERLPSDLRLSVTALPTWTSSPALDRLLAVADEAVLQVHAVDPPDRGLFDPERGADAVDAYAGRTDHPLRVAVPAYGLRLRDGGELRVDPAAVVGFVGGLDPDVVAGVLWFRVPTPSDPRAWPLDAIRSAIRGEVPHGSAHVEVIASGHGVYDLTVANDGLAWVPLPTELAASGGCTLADGIGGYEVQGPADPMVTRFRRVRPGPLDPGAKVAVGWVRCERAPEVR